MGTPGAIPRSCQPSRPASYAWRGRPHGQGSRQAGVGGEAGGSGASWCARPAGPHGGARRRRPWGQDRVDCGPGRGYRAGRSGQRARRAAPLLSWLDPVALASSSQACDPKLCKTLIIRLAVLLSFPVGGDLRGVKEVSDRAGRGDVDRASLCADPEADRRAGPGPRYAPLQAGRTISHRTRMDQRRQPFRGRPGGRGSDRMRRR